MAAPLTPSRRSELRAQATRSSPIVIIGDKGLTDQVVAEIDRSLKAHELIKVRRRDRRSCRALAVDAGDLHAPRGARRCRQIGKVLVIYRENFDKPREKQLDPGSLPRKRGGRDDTGYSYFTPTISNSFTPPGVRTSTTSPSLFPISAFAIGEE
jgi:putative YhbY family RNA-binding protein